MIQEVKNFSKNIIAAITPASLASQNDIQPMDVNGKYNWKSQSYSYDICNFGTSRSTNIKTGGNGDRSPDSYGD